MKPEKLRELQEKRMRALQASLEELAANVARYQRVAASVDYAADPMSWPIPCVVDLRNMVAKVERQENAFMVLCEVSQAS